MIPRPRHRYFRPRVVRRSGGTGQVRWHRSIRRTDRRRRRPGFCRGESGAGKSSLTAALIAEGAQFISDDLSVVAPDKDGNGWSVVKGRPGIRLFPSVGRWFFGDNKTPLPDDPRGKVIAVPAANLNDRPVPLRQIIFLGGPGKSLSAIDRFMLLRKNLFRPKWLGKLPGIAAIRVAVRDISASAKVNVEPVIGETNELALRARATAIIDTVRSAA